MSHTLIYVLISSLAIMLVSLIGTIFVFKKLSGWMETNLNYLVSFSAGVFFIVAINLGRESLELSSSNFIGILSILAGILLMYLISKLFPEGHHHHESGEDHPHTKLGAKRMLIGDAIHNLGDGILLAPAFVIDIRLGLLTALGILIHEVVQEISEFFVLKEAGYSNREALKRNFLVSGVILIGVILGYFLSSIDYLIGPLVGIASGSFFYIVSSDLIPKSIASSKTEGTYLKYFLWSILGILLILALSFLNV